MFHTSKGLHRTLVWLALKHVDAVFDTIPSYFSNKGMLDTLYIMVPMAIHQIRYQTTCCLRKIIWILLDDLVEIDAMEQDDLTAVRREFESLDILRCL